MNNLSTNKKTDDVFLCAIIVIFVFNKKKPWENSVCLFVSNSNAFIMNYFTCIVVVMNKKSRAKNFFYILELLPFQAQIRPHLDVFYIGKRFSFLNCHIMQRFFSRIASSSAKNKRIGKKYNPPI